LPPLPLCEARAKIVFGSGNEQAKLVFVGEGPGADEDAQGFPFVGRAGQLLTQMIENTAAKEGIPIKRPTSISATWSNAVPPRIEPRFRTKWKSADSSCSGNSSRFNRRRSARWDRPPLKHCWAPKKASPGCAANGTSGGDIPLLVTFHPSYLLRPYNQDAKREAWEDLKKLLHFVYD
jgi:DNA polymerase